MLKDEGYRLVGAAFEVYNQLGFGMSEEIYQQSLEIELALRGIPFESKPELRVQYKSQELQTRYRPDLIVYNAIVVELKACTELISEHQAQLFNYLRISSSVVGYLINFGHKRELQWKRITLAEQSDRSRAEYGEIEQQTE